MTKSEYDEYSQRRELLDANWRVNKRDAVAFNHGSETVKHAMCKLAAAWVLRERDYRIDSEVEMDHGEVDILAYGRSDGDKIAVECETSPTQDVIEDKIERYVYNEPVRECYVLNVSEMPVDMLEAVEWVRNQL